jgi:precorrin-6B methylase 2
LLLALVTLLLGQATAAAAARSEPDEKLIGGSRDHNMLPNKTKWQALSPQHTVQASMPAVPWSSMQDSSRTTTA